MSEEYHNGGHHEHEPCPEHQSVKWKANLNVILQIVNLGLLGMVLLFMVELRGDNKAQTVTNLAVHSRLEKVESRIDSYERAVLQRLRSDGP